MRANKTESGGGGRTPAFQLDNPKEKKVRGAEGRGGSGTCDCLYVICGENGAASMKKLEGETPAWNEDDYGRSERNTLRG